MNKKRKTIKTTKQEIIDYWIKCVDESDSNFDWAEADKICWRCGCERNLQRCHIIPESIGGKDEPSNFVLLCADCHEEAPNVEDKKFMWDWINSYHFPFYNTSPQERAMEEYNRIYHKSFIQELKDRNIVTHHALYHFFHLKVGKTSYHFGHPYGNISTITGKYKMYLDAFDKKHPSKKYASDKKIEKEKDFEQLTSSICKLAKAYNFSVWEGSSKNPYSLCISAFFPKVGNYYSVSIKADKSYGYKMCITNECNPNNIPISNYNIKLVSNHDIILDRIKKELNNFIKLYGNIENTNPYFYIIRPY